MHKVSPYTLSDFTCVFTDIHKERTRYALDTSRSPYTLSDFTRVCTDIHNGLATCLARPRNPYTLFVNVIEKTD